MLRSRFTLLAACLAVLVLISAWPTDTPKPQAPNSAAPALNPNPSDPSALGRSISASAPAMTVTTVAGWEQSNAMDAQELNMALGGADLGMPFDGATWLSFSGTGSVAAQGPSNPGGFGQAPSDCISLTRQFQLTGQDTKLVFAAIFLLNENPGTVWNDFLSVDVSAAGQTFNLLYLDTNSALGGTSSRYNKTLGGAMPGTVMGQVSQDLVQLFPQADSNTVFTLSVSIGNAIDASLPSRGYFDGFTFAQGSTIPAGIPPSELKIESMVTGDWLMTCSSPTWPHAEVYNLFSAAVFLPLGQGPLLGITPDYNTYYSIWQPLGVHPLHVGLDGSGRYQFVIPAWVNPGLQFDAVMVVVSAGAIVDVSKPIRVQF